MDPSTARRIAGVAGVLGIVALGLVSSLTEWLRVCEDVLAEAGNTPVVETCHPMGVTDVPVLGLAVVVALAFAPDVGELGLFGLVSWKRKVDETAAGQAELSQKVADMRVAIAQTQAQNLTVNLPQTEDLRGALRDAIADLPAKEREYL